MVKETAVVPEQGTEVVKGEETHVVIQKGLR